MKSLLLFSAFYIFYLCLIPKDLFANHATGGSLTYSHLGGNLYSIHVEFYRDCSGDAIPVTVTVYISSAQCGVMDSIILNQSWVPDAEVPMGCYSLATTCTGGTAPGLQRQDYETNYTFPFQCSDWVLSANLGTRNVTITNIQHPYSANLYLEARLNNIGFDNTSPQCSNGPIVLSCVNQNFVFNPGFVDADGDSLVYELIAARIDANTSVIYNIPYSGLQPINSSPPVTFDPGTGDMTFFPQALEFAVVDYRVLEYRNGMLIGSVMFEMYVYMIPCSNTMPSVSGIYGTMNFDYYVLPGPFCFDIYSYDPDTSDTLILLANTINIPSATFISFGAPRPTGTFCWNPDSADVRPQPYTFTVFVEDDYCPQRGSQDYSFNIYVTLDSSLVTQFHPPVNVSEIVAVVPNPFHHQAEIIFSKSFINVETQFTIMDVTGRVMDRRTVNASSVYIQRGNLIPGIYYFGLDNSSGNHFTGKFIVE